MHEIKFRVWDIGEEKMLEDVSIPLLREYYDSGTIHTLNDVFSQLLGIELLQYTGLKDKNGKVIYEGDIVEINMGQILPAYLKVTYGGPWDYAGFGLTHKRPKPPFNEDETDYTWDALNPQYAKDCEVIGNIYENPDLLKKVHDEPD